MVLAVCSISVAGILEIHRKHLLRNHQGFYQTVAGTTHFAARISVLYQVPQFVLMGASEVFASVTGICQK